jgi:hypothetical protein
VKDVLGPLGTAVESAYAWLSEHHASSIEQHEKLIKDAHDQLAEASRNFKKAAVERQVDVMEMHNDLHKSLKEEVQELATKARKQFRGQLRSSSSGEACLVSC